MSRSLHRRPHSPALVLAALCLSVFVINVSTTIVNIALPALVVELDATTRDLLWIVDAFNLAFAAFVLAAGSLSDRFGRRGWLLGGLAVFAAASLGGAWADDAGTLIAWRAAAGLGAAVIFPVTLSIIVDVFVDAGARARAIGVWGAATGAAIAAGPIVGGFFLERFWWGSILVFTGLVALVALAGAAVVVPTSRTRRRHASTVAAWCSRRSPSGPSSTPSSRGRNAAGPRARARGIRAGGRADRRLRGRRAPRGRADARPRPVPESALHRRQRRRDRRLLRAVRLRVPDHAVLPGHQGYAPLETGLRILPVAVSVAVTSVGGARLALRVGTKAVVAGGLVLLSVGFAWISTAGGETTYLEIALQMVTVGSGMGLTTAPATEAIMGVVPAAKAGVGSAVNDATREIGGTLGVAVIGSVALSIYRAGFDGAELPRRVLERAEGSVVAAVELGRTYRGSDPTLGGRIVDVAQAGFLDGLAAGCLVASGVTLLAAVLTALYLPARPLVRPAAAADVAPLPG
jgi:predicted MFS family arabinose efflux permease